MYLLFFMAWYVMVLRGATSLRGALEGVGPENLDFFGPKWHKQSECHFRAQKSLDFQGSPLPMPWVMMLHPSKPLSISAIKTTGTLVVLCTSVLLCIVVVCCCLLLGVLVRCGVLLHVRGVGRFPCSYVVWAGIQGEGAQPSPSHYSVVFMDACWWVGGAIVT